MAPSSPPASLMSMLTDDLITEILLRVAPDDVAWLPRAALACKTWRRLLSDRAFHRRYRELHGGSPMLGFLYNNYSTGASVPLFLHTTQPSPLPPPASTTNSPTYCRTLDCRHGRVLLFHPGSECKPRFTVWDPITGRERCFSAPANLCRQFTGVAAVLCASNGCDHVGCSGSGPFLVVLLDKTRRDSEVGPPWNFTVVPTRACIYSSETGKWSVSAAIDLHSFTSIRTPSLLAGDTLFFPTGPSRSAQILKYDLTRGVLSAIWVPPIHHVENMILCTPEDGGLGLGVAAVEGCSLRLLSGRTDPINGVTRWAQGRAIELDSIIPNGVGGAPTKFYAVGFAEGTGYIFIRANDSIFSVEVKSHRISKIGNGKFGPIFPFMGF